MSSARCAKKGKQKKINMNARRSKLMAFERKDFDGNSLAKSYYVRKPNGCSCTLT